MSRAQGEVVLGEFRHVLMLDEVCKVLGGVEYLFPDMKSIFQQRLYVYLGLCSAGCRIEDVICPR